LHGEDRIILSIRPGITGPATLKYRDEETLLASRPDPEAYNRDVIFPDKVRMNREYIEDYSFIRDLLYIWKTVTG
jgi:lipopolysaccharide/colanic/teichoic acid biosynthesis glycosyltransferase